jgi:hypothetical protein
MRLEDSERNSDHTAWRNVLISPEWCIFSMLV